MPQLPLPAGPPPAPYAPAVTADQFAALLAQNAETLKIVQASQQEQAKLAAENAQLRAEFAALKKGKAAEPEVEHKPFVPHYSSKNPFPERPKFRANEEPVLYEPANIDPTWQTLVAQAEAEGKSRSALGWEYYHRLSELSYLFDSNLHKEKVFSRLIERLRDPTKLFADAGGEPITADDDIVNLAAIYNTDVGVYNMSNQRVSLIQLRAKLGKDVPEEQKGLLSMFEAEVYGVLGPMPANLDAIFAKCMQEWQKQTKTQIVKDAARNAAKGGRGEGNKKGKQKNKAGGAKGGALADVKGKPKDEE